MAKTKTIKSVRIESHVEEVTAELVKKAEIWFEAVGLDAASTAREVAPYQTGRLKNSIHHKVVKNELAVYIGTNVKYAPYQEFGTSRGVPGRHYLQFGCTAHMDDYKQLLESVLKE